MRNDEPAQSLSYVQCKKYDVRCGGGDCEMRIIASRLIVTSLFERPLWRFYYALKIFVHQVFLPDLFKCFESRLPTVANIFFPPFVFYLLHQYITTSQLIKEIIPFFSRLWPGKKTVFLREQLVCP